MAESLPTLFLSHGAPPLVDGALWVSQLATWARDLQEDWSTGAVPSDWSTEFDAWAAGRFAAGASTELI